jgi:hypothetical protein
MWTDQYPFSPEQLARLAVYKAAVDAGFYSDDTAESDGQPPITRSQIARSFQSPGWRLFSQPQPTE